MGSLKEYNIEFTGWWIPVEISKITGFNVIQMFLWAEIMALSKGENGCFIKNETFAKKFGVNKNTITKNIAVLKAKGLVTQISFDGRNRQLVAKYPSDTHEL